ncbi:MAG: nitroreductase family deazaflavin-dependent oxidoreductase [bacterium]
MSSEEEIHDSPKGWVADHIRSYTESGGKRGHRWRGVNTLLLTTRGRKTGKLRRTALIYGGDGERYLVVASIGGAPKHPEWYLNLVANPEVRVQIGEAEFEAIASTVTGDERSEYWNQMAKIWPDYNNYQNRTNRTIPVVILEPR